MDGMGLLWTDWWARHLLGTTFNTLKNHDFMKTFTEDTPTDTPNTKSYTIC